MAASSGTKGRSLGILFVCSWKSLGVTRKHFCLLEVTGEQLMSAQQVVLQREPVKAVDFPTSIRAHVPVHPNE